MIQAASINDPLTGLLTRKAFEDSFVAALEQAQAAQSSLSLAMLDIDNFLQINNQLGHAGGDVVLKAIAEILKQIGQDVLLARYGGDEFAILFPNTEREQAFLKLERVRAEVEGRTSFSDGDTTVDIRMTLSAGIAAFPIDGTMSTS